MKPGIHPEYRPVVFHDTSVDEYFVVGSTLHYTLIALSNGKMAKLIHISLSMYHPLLIRFTPVSNVWFKRKVVLRTLIVALVNLIKIRTKR